MKTKLRKLDKGQKKQNVLFALVELYIETGKPVGSSVLRESCFQDISPATIRNYFAKLEKEDLLKQQHISGGRIPTDKAFSLYVNKILDEKSWDIEKNEKKNILSLANEETKAIAKYLQNASETLSQITKCAVFMSAPRFDHDFILNVKLMPIDCERYLCVLITDFGLVHTEIFYKDEKISLFTLKRIEDYFCWRITGKNRPENLTPKEEMRAKKLYNEIMVRYVVGYSNFSQEDIYRTGFSRLLEQPDFNDIVTLTNGLSLLENSNDMRKILNEGIKHGEIKTWIGKELKEFSKSLTQCSTISIPYYINQNCVGAIGLLGAMRMPYKKLFAALTIFSESISKALTNNIYKFKISYRKPSVGSFYIGEKGAPKINNSDIVLLEDKREM